MLTCNENTVTALRKSNISLHEYSTLMISL